MKELNHLHVLLIKAQKAGNFYRSCMAELRHHGVGSEEKDQLWEEIQEICMSHLAPKKVSTLDKLMSKAPK